LCYLPFGESFVDQRVTNYEGSRYTFSGKERDSETGYSYFGARYYSSDYSIWLSVDPLADKYPSMSPYMYCAGNPVRLVDVDGRDWYIPEDAEYAKQLIEQAKERQKSYDSGSEEYNMLQEGIDGLTFMGETKDITFTFSESACVDNLKHGESVKGNVIQDEHRIIHINYLYSNENESVKDGTSWHEIIHLTRFFKQRLEYALWEDGGFYPPIPPQPDYGYRMGDKGLGLEFNQYNEEYHSFSSQFIFSSKSMPLYINSKEEIPQYIENQY